MLRKPEACKSCPIYGSGFGFIPSQGTPHNGVTLVGEAGGENEAKHGEPFYRFAQAGSKLEEVLKLLRQPRNHFRVGNIVSCRPPANLLENMPYELTVVNHCKKNRPEGKVLVALGKIPLKYLTGKSGEAKETIGMLRGYYIPSPSGIVVPTYHPSFVKRGKPGYIQYLLWDIQKALNYAKSPPEKTKYRFSENPTWEDAKSYYYRVKDSPSSPLAYDIETEDSSDTEEDERQGLTSNTITQIQFSLAKDEGIAFPWNENFFKIIRLLLLTENLKLGFNSYNYDDPRLVDKGFQIRGTRIDVMWMWKHWNPGLERGLQKVASCFDYPEPWKHTSSENLAKYGCHDVSSLHYIFPKLKEWMERDGIWS